MHQKIFFTYFLKSKNVPKRKKEVNNPRHFDQVYVKNAKFNWTRTAMSPNLLLIPFRVLGPTLLSPGDFGHYSLKEILADHRLWGPQYFLQKVLHILEKCKTYLNQISIWTSLHLFVKMIIDHGSQPFVFYVKIIYIFF